MKQTLNEQVNRIKTIMGCSGTLNEDDTNCVDIESEQGTQMVNTLASSIKTLGLSNDDITYSDTASPEVAETKKKITDMMNPILKSSSSQQIDAMIKDVRDLRRQRRQEKRIKNRQLHRFRNKVSLYGHHRLCRFLRAFLQVYGLLLVRGLYYVY